MLRLVVCLSGHLSGPLLEYQLGACQASVRVSVSASVRAPVGHLSGHHSECLLWQLLGCPLRYPLAHLLVHMSGDLLVCLLGHIDLNCIMYRVILSS